MPALEAFAIGKSVIPFFAKMAEGYIKKAQEYKDQDIRAFENYLEAARTAMTGLEAEYDKILVQAIGCDLSQKDQIKALMERIDTYLKVDLLRPNLQAAVAGLGQCRNALQKNAEAFLLWFWPPLQEKREEAIAGFNKLLQDLEQYLIKLDVGWGSGVDAENLRKINEYLAERPEGNIDPLGLARLASPFQRYRSKDQFLEYIKRITETTHLIKNAFK